MGRSRRRRTEQIGRHDVVSAGQIICHSGKIALHGTILRRQGSAATTNDRNPVLMTNYITVRVGQQLVWDRS